ncbi:MAG: response regulator transcription factor [Bacteroidaceae bacterium]|nr:response regulator transcription factor [Bacteroidaceae bacterium]
MMTKRILIVDDEPDICEILRFNLEMEGYDVDVAEGADEGQGFIMRNLSVGKQTDLILLDVMMTPKSGFEWASELKQNYFTANIPIIFCTAKTLEEDLMQGFALGSDDYICKPFRISEVKARIKAVLRRTSPNDNKGVDENKVSSANIVTYEGIKLDLDRKECFIDGKEVVFTKLEFEVLALLLSKPGQVFSREKILSFVWPSDTIVLDRTVDVNITRIRKKIGRYGEYLRTKFGYGYMFGK